MKYQVIRVSKGGNETVAKEFNSFKEAEIWADNANMLPYGVDSFYVSEKKERKRNIEYNAIPRDYELYLDKRYSTGHLKDF